MPKRKSHTSPIIGAVFSKDFKGKTYNMTVVKADWGLGYKVNNVAYKTPTAAAISITNNSVNGWVFWGIEM